MGLVMIQAAPAVACDMLPSFVKPVADCPSRRSSAAAGCAPGQVGQEDTTVLRVAASLYAWQQGELDDDAGDGERADWDKTNKYRVVWILPRSEWAECRNAGASDSISNMLWRKGHLHLAMSAPQSEVARWRIRVKPAVSLHYAGAEVVCLLLAWVGDRVFAHAALRKSADELGILAPLFNVADIHSANLMILPPRLVLVAHTVLRTAKLLCAPMFGWTS